MTSNKTTYRVDTAWYLQTYPDVAASGMDAQDHYERHGRYEGRLPYGMRAFELETALWGGFSRYAHPELYRLAKRPGAGVESVYACWALVRFEAAHENWHQAEKLLSPLTGEVDPLLAESTGRILLAVEVLLRCGQLQKAREELGSALDRHGPLPDLCLAAANACLPVSATPRPTGAELRLHWINQALASGELAPLARRTLTRPLSLDNLQSAEKLPSCGSDLPLVSVIMPVFNAEATVATAIRGLQAQSWTNLEILVVDDCSTDGSVDVVKNLAAQDDRILLLKQSRNQGAYAARNLGLQNARGVFITNHDSDDWSHPQRLERMAHPLLENESLQASLGSWVRVDDWLHFKRWRMEAGLVHHSVSTLMFRRDVIDRIGSWDEVSIEADTELYQRLLRIYGEKSVAHILPGVPLAFALQAHHSLTGSKTTHLRTQFWGVRRLYREISRAWHDRAASSPDILYLEPGTTNRPFPAPPAMLRKSEPVQVDILLAADCGEKAPDHLRIRDYICRLIDTGRSIGLFHWPNYQRPLESMATVFLEMALDNMLELVLPDQHVQAGQYLLLGAGLNNYPPDGLPHVTGCSLTVLTALPENDKAHASRLQTRKNPRELVEDSGLFDPAWYLRRYSDVRASQMDPLDHYLEFGGKEGREPGPDFDTGWYLSQCSRARDAGQAPLLHYLQTGVSLGCTPRCPEIRGERGFDPDRPTILVCAHACGGHLFGAERSFLDILAACNALPVNTLASVPSMGNPDYLKALQGHAHTIFHTSADLWHADRPPCPAAIARFEDIIRTHEVDAVHVNTLLLREPLLAARRAHIPGLVHVRESLEHDPDMCESIGLSARKIKKEVLKKADAIIANSAFTARCFKHPRLTFVVGNTLDPQLLHMDNPLDPKYVHLGMISSNLPKKGLFDCVKVARLLLDEPRVRLHLVGPENEHTRALEKQGLPANMTVDGYAPSPRAALEKIQVLLNLSHFEETFGRTVLEAMAAKRPVIAYRWGALPELIKNGKNGFLVNKGNVRSVADRVQKLAADRDLIVSMGEQGRKRVADYLPEHVCEQLRRVYVQVIERKKM